MTTEALALARAVVLDGLREDAALFIAMQYLGMIDGAALKKQFAEDLNPDPPRVENVVQTPYFDQDGQKREMYVAGSRPIQTMKGSPFQTNPDGTVSYVGKKSQSRSLFAAWMEKEVKWSPAVFGWEEDHPLADAARREIEGA